MVVSEVVNDTDPVGIFDGFVVSATVTVQVSMKLKGTEEGQEMAVDVLSNVVTVTLTVVGVVVAPSGEPVTMKLYGPAATEDATLIVKTLVVPAVVGVTGLTMRLPQVIPAGRLLLTHDNVTG